MLVFLVKGWVIRNLANSRKDCLEKKTSTLIGVRSQPWQQLPVPSTNDRNLAVAREGSDLHAPLQDLAPVTAIARYNWSRSLFIPMVTVAILSMAD